MWRREETRPVGPARAARSRRLSPTLRSLDLAPRADSARARGRERFNRFNLGSVWPQTATEWLSRRPNRVEDSTRRTYRPATRVKWITRCRQRRRLADCLETKAVVRSAGRRRVLLSDCSSGWPVSVAAALVLASFRVSTCASERGRGVGHGLRVPAVVLWSCSRGWIGRRG
jgi:hypothetical protein